MTFEIKTNTKTEQILTVMYFITWCAFIGILIQTGVILLSYGVSWVNPQAAMDLYEGLDLHTLRQFNVWHYTQAVSFMVALSAMKAYILFLVIQALSKVNLMNPFTIEVAKKLETISSVLFGVWLVSVLNNSHARWLLKTTGIVHETSGAEEYIFIAGLVFIISQVFKRGVEIQSENELTV